jgi:hypothetical protein
VLFRSPDLFLLLRRERELGGHASNRSRWIWSRLQERGRLRTRAEDAPVEERMAHGADGNPQNKHEDDQRQGLAIAVAE